MKEQFTNTPEAFYCYVIPGNPVPLARPRIKRDRVYNSQRNELNAAGFVLLNQHKGEPFNFPISLQVIFFMPPPQKQSTKLQGRPHHIKPDIDNLLKFILDAGNKVIWYDDSLISLIGVKKVYDSNSRTEIIVRPVNQNMCL